MRQDTQFFFNWRRIETKRFGFAIVQGQIMSPGGFQMDVRETAWFKSGVIYLENIGHQLDEIIARDTLVSTQM